MDKIRFLLILLISISYVQAEIISIELKYIGEFKYMDSEVVDGNLPGGITKESDHHYEAYRAGGSVFDKGPVLLPGPVLADPMQETVKVPTAVYLSLPFDPDVTSMTIFKGEEAVLDIDLSHLGPCNRNNLCDEEETHSLCPDECDKEDNLCTLIEDGICTEDPDCEKEDPDCGAQPTTSSPYKYAEDISSKEEQEETSNLIVPIIIGLVLIGVMMEIYLKKR